MKDTSADVAKAARLLDWQPTTPPAEGFARTAAWHLENAPWLDSIRLG